MSDRLFAVAGNQLKDLSHRTEKIVTDQRQLLAILAEESNVHQVIELTKDSKDNPMKLIYETDLGFPGYKFMDED